MILKESHLNTCSDIDYYWTIVLQNQNHTGFPGFQDEEQDGRFLDQMIICICDGILNLSREQYQVPLVSLFVSW